MASWPAYSPRSTESPMDFEYTSRPSTSTAPAWASRGSEPTTPRKRSLGETVTPTSPFPGTPHTPTFGRMHNVPFMMNMPPPEAPSTPAWDPHELKDIDMAEASPPQPHAEQNENENGNVYAESGGGRRIATGGMVRVFRSRQKYKEKERERSRLAVTRTRVQVEDEDENEDSGIESDEDDRNGRVTPITQNTSNHYTLNIPGPIAPQSETPYVLLGYLQFFFNSSLVLLFLYLLVLFILTVQRDVQHRISEYSMDNVQEITQCALHFKNNLCHSPIPAMVHQCGIWETCMNRDPTKIGRTKVVAEVIAEVINGFVEPITWKTLIFTLTSLAFLTLFINSLLSFYRSRYNPSTPPPHRQHHAPIHPYPYDSIPAIAPPYLAQGWGKSWMGVGEGKQWVGEGQQVEEGASRRRKLEGGRKEDVLVKS